MVQPNSTELERILQDMDGKKPSMSQSFLNSFESAIAFSKGDLENAKGFAEKVMATKKLKGTTKFYQEILRNTVLKS